jgi:malonyl-CoA O-methyltransferase
MAKTLHLSVAEAYDRWAASYDGYDNPMVFGATRIVAELASASAARRIFEFGCGTGRNLQAFAEAGGAEFAGCDLSAAMLAAAEKRCPGALLFLQDMATPIPLPDGWADRVLFSLTLEHVEDVVAPLREARRLLRPGGRIDIVEIHPHLALDGVGAHFEEGGQVVTMPTVPHTFASYLNAFSEAGLHVCNCREWRPADFGSDLPAKVVKRGQARPLLVQFSLVPLA